MKTQLQEAMTSGVLVEFFDAEGRPQGQIVYLDWRGRPLPAVGDCVSCKGVASTAGTRVDLTGHVRQRHFDVQTDEEGAPCVWVRLAVDAQSARHFQHYAYRSLRDQSGSFWDN